VFRMAGALGMSEDNLWNTSPKVLVWMYQGLIEAQEAMYQTMWETARFTSLTVANSQGAKIRDAKKLIAFPWEANRPSTLTRSEIKRLKNKFEHGIK
jgi:hypothetical protein